MTFLEYVNKLLDEIKDNKSLDFKTADSFIQRINGLNYQDGTKLSYEDNILFKSSWFISLCIK